MAADTAARNLRLILHQLLLPLSMAMRSFLDAKGWSQLGYARLEDYTREMLDRSGRWARDLGSLAEAIKRLPGLDAAVTGTDGGPALGMVAALLISRVARRETLDWWVRSARELPVRELRQHVGEALSGTQPHAEGRHDAGEQEPRVMLRLSMPHEVRSTFDDTLDLFRAMEGQELTPAVFAEALVAEGMAAGTVIPDPVSDPLPVAGLARMENALAQSTGKWRHLDEEQPMPELGRVRVLLRRLAVLLCRPIPSHAIPLHRHMAALLALEGEGERRLGGLLAEMSEQGAWKRLRFGSVGHYAEERLRLSRRAAESRVQLARNLGAFPDLQAAYEAGRIGQTAARELVAWFRDWPTPRSSQGVWAEHASHASIKRLRDEMRALSRQKAGDPSSPAGPMDDASWHASLLRRMGSSRQRLQQLGAGFSARRERLDAVLAISLPASVALDFRSGIECERRRLAAGALDSSLPISTKAAQMFSTTRRRLPSWVGLLALLENFINTWDDPRRLQRRPRDRVYSRDGWRCAAPGCTSRRNLEDHHVVYRSRGGGDEEWNRVCLCRFHHQMGEHGGLASCRGRAPLGLLWRLGRNGEGGTYRNEMRLRASAAAS